MAIKSKEAIRNRILDYAHIIWDVKRTDHLHPLIHLMIEEVCNELYLLDNKLHDIDATILEKLVHNISPTQFSYVRPASTIMHTRPDRKKFYLHQKSEFFVKEVPDFLRRKYISSVVFSPVTAINLYDIGISHLFSGNTLWQVDDLGNKIPLADTTSKVQENKLWLGITNPSGIKQIDNLYFYIDFQHLNANHEYYDVFPLLRWTAENKPLEITSGLPITSKESLTRIEKETLDYYKIHYQTIATRLNIGDKAHQTIPAELRKVLGEETSASVPALYWICIEFPSHFLADDLENIQILVNAFPALNRRYVNYRQQADTFTGVIALPSEIGEQFLELEKIQDSNKNNYAPTSGDTAARNKQGAYTIEPIRKKDISDTRLQDYLELFIDVIERERTVFPKLDRDKIIDLQRSVSRLVEEQSQKIDSNILNDYAEVARVSLNPNEDVSFIDTSYTTTLAETANAIPIHTSLMASKVTALNKSETLLISPVRGGRVFYDTDSMKAVNRFYMTSRGRILTKHDIISFCKIEIGRYAKEIDVVRCAKISTRPGLGIINAMEIRITPIDSFISFFDQKEVLRELRLRLAKYSPSNYNYVVKIITEK